MIVKFSEYKCISRIYFQILLLVINKVLTYTKHNSSLIFQLGKFFLMQVKKHQCLKRNQFQCWQMNTAHSFSRQHRENNSFTVTYDTWNFNRSHFLNICQDSDNFLQLSTCQFFSYLLKYFQTDQFLSCDAGKSREKQEFSEPRYLSVDRELLTTLQNACVWAESQQCAQMEEQSFKSITRLKT